MNNKRYRMSELLDATDGRSLVVDTSRGIVMGALPGLEHFEEAVRPLFPLLDGLVTSPGQARLFGSRTRQDAALLIRADWTNALRGEDFVLPPETIQYIPLLNAEDALDLGANAMVMSFILGHEEEIEANCIQQVVSLALQGVHLGMPLLVDVQPVGPRVVLQNKAIELGVSYALEGGADGVIISWPGTQSFHTIQGMCNGLPVWVRPGSLEMDAPELNEALLMGAVGWWIDERIFSLKDYYSYLDRIKSILHSPGVVK